jgi:hypothetical protein
MYSKDHGTTTMSRHVASKHFLVLKLYQMQCSDIVTQFDVLQIAKKKKNSFATSISDFFNNGTPYKKTNPV